MRSSLTPTATPPVSWKKRHRAVMKIRKSAVGFKHLSQELASLGTRLTKKTRKKTILKTKKALWNLKTRNHYLQAHKFCLPKKPIKKRKNIHPSSGISTNIFQLVNNLRLSPSLNWAAMKPVKKGEILHAKVWKKESLLRKWIQSQFKSKTITRNWLKSSNFKSTL